MGATNFDTNLVIKTDLASNLDIGPQRRRVYIFYYELRLESKLPEEALTNEKGVFNFQVRYFMDSMDFYQCELQSITFYTGSTDTYDLFCMYSGIDQLNF